MKYKCKVCKDINETPTLRLNICKENDKWGLFCWKCYPKEIKSALQLIESCNPSLIEEILDDGENIGFLFKE